MVQSLSGVAELLQHFSYWASMWWLPNAHVQRQPEVSVLNGSMQAQPNNQETDEQDGSSETESEAYHSCSSECNSSDDQGIDVDICDNAVSTIAGGRKYFQLSFDEHGQDHIDEAHEQETYDVRTTGDVGQVSATKVKYAAQCRQARVKSWPRGRVKKQTAERAPQWEALPGSQETAVLWPAFRQAEARTTLQEPLGCQTCDWYGKDGVACFLHDGEVLCKSCLQEGTCFCGSFCSYEDRGVCVECGGPCREEDLFGRAGSSTEEDHGAGESEDAVSESECDLCGKASPSHRRDGVLTCHSCYLHLYSQDSDSDDVPEVPFFPPGKCEGQLQGLVGSACLNGHWAVFWQFHEDKNRWEVTVSGKRVFVKKENIDFGTMRFTPGG